MSYIRCLRNPEGLYIWGELGGKVAITGHKIKGIKYIPSYIFKKLLKDYLKKSYKNKFKYRGAILEEVFIASKRKPNKLTKQMGFKEGNHKWELSYKDWKFNMWESTLYYLAKRNDYRK